MMSRGQQSSRPTTRTDTMKTPELDTDNATILRFKLRADPAKGLEAKEVVVTIDADFDSAAEAAGGAHKLWLQLCRWAIAHSAWSNTAREKRPDSATLTAADLFAPRKREGKGTKAARDARLDTLKTLVLDGIMTEEQAETVAQSYGLTLKDDAEA